MHLERALTGVTSSNRRDKHGKDFLSSREITKRRGWNEDNVAAPDIHQRGEDVNPSEEGLMRLPLRDLENSMCAPSCKGGVANVQCAVKATR